MNLLKAYHKNDQESTRAEHLYAVLVYAIRAVSSVTPSHKAPIETEAICHIKLPGVSDEHNRTAFT